MKLAIVPIVIAISLAVCVVLVFSFFPNLTELAKEWNETKIKFKEGFLQAKIRFSDESPDYFEPNFNNPEPNY